FRSENEEEIKTAMDRTVWQKIKEASNRGRSLIYNIFKEISGPTEYAKRNILSIYTAKPNKTVLILSSMH
ncbi:hypothetical protein PV325_008400, partial [Microctonus aethiopoides]